MSDIEMPQLGETVTEGTITRWFKQVGEEVGIDEVLFEVSTDKVDSEVPSPVGGVLTEIRVQEGETVDVGTVLAVIGDGAAASAPSAQPAAEPEQPAAEEEQPAAEPEQPAPEEEQPAAQAEAPAEAPAAQAAAPAAEAAPAQASAGVDGDGEAIDGRLLSPVVRRLIREHELDPDSIAGTGIGGRITRKDVLDAIDRDQSSAAKAPAEPAAQAETPSPQPPAAAQPSQQAPAPAARAEPERAPARAAESLPATAAGPSEWTAFSNIRRRTGEHMANSKTVAPHAMTIMQVDYEGVDVVRRGVKEGFKADEGFSLTYLPFIARATVDALREWPNLNASVEGEGLRAYRDINLGVAVDLDFEGLIVPVIRQADGKRLRALAREVNDLAERARTKKLGVDEITGGTFTISNNGSFGTYATEAIINQPQVAVLSTDGIARTPVVVTDQYGSESIAIHSVGHLAMAWDHRAFDGSYAGAFLRRVKEILETRDWSAEL